MLEARIQRVSQEILKVVQKEGAISFQELERSLEIPFNLLFLAIDQMVRDRTIQLIKRGPDYLISLRVTWTQSTASLPSSVRQPGSYRH